jgi:hypothetical protein
MGRGRLSPVIGRVVETVVILAEGVGDVEMGLLMLGD